MNWTSQLVDSLGTMSSWGYCHDGPSTTEPTALAALALWSRGRGDQAEGPLAWLVGQQSADGSLGITADRKKPCWPTSLAVLAWSTATRLTADPPASEYRQHIRQAVRWILTAKGQVSQNEEVIGHDTTLVGWPWVDGTHSWIEPTAMHLLALQATGYGDHPRSREAARLLHDRLLPDGGCNYGNTFVFGQQLPPHVQSTGLSLLALTGRDQTSDRIPRSLEYLDRTLSARTTTSSLCYGLLALAAHGREPERADSWLAAAYRRTLAREKSAYKLALLALAALGKDCPLVDRWAKAALP